MENIIFEFYKGRTYTRDFTITGWSRQINQIYFTVKSAIDDKVYTIQKKIGKGITLVDEGQREDGNVFHVYNILIEAMDTDALQINKKYIFDIAIVSDNIKQTVLTGVLRLKGTATATNNEEEG